MTKLRKLMSATLVAGIVAATLSACNTVEGVGKDIKSAGKTIEKAGESNK